MIENKKEIFEHGLRMFVEGYCGGDQLHYTVGMVRGDGYKHAAKEFYKKLGYLTEKDRDDLFEKDIVPLWMQDIYCMVEKSYFGITLWDKQ